MHGVGRPGLSVSCPSCRPARRTTPLYDVLHTNSNEQWSCARPRGWSMPKIDAKEVPERRRRLSLCRQRQDRRRVRSSPARSASASAPTRGSPSPPRGRISPIRKLAGVRGGYIIPVNSLGQCHLMMLGKIYGKGLHRSRRRLQGAGAAEADQAGRLHRPDGKDAAVGRGRPMASSTIPASIATTARTSRSTSPPVRGRAGARAGAERHAGLQGRRSWPSPISTTCCGPTCRRLLAEARLVFAGQQEGEARRQVRRQASDHAEAKVATLIQPDWKWYNARKDDIDARVTEAS